MAKSRRLRQAKKKENEWSRVDLPSPPQFNGTNFAMWTSRMRVYLRYVDTHVDMNDEAKDVLALHLIQRAVDDRLIQNIAAAKTSKEAMKILEAQFSARGICHEEADEEDDEVVTDLASVSEAEHDQEAYRESHNAVKHVDDENSESYSAGAHVDGEDEAAIVAAENVEATQEVAGQPSEAALVDEEELVKSKALRENDFADNCLECAGTLVDQAVEVEEPLGDETKYDDEILSDEELQNLEMEISLIADLMNGRVAEKENSAHDNDDCLMVHDLCTAVAEVGEEEVVSSGIAAKKNAEDSSKGAAKQNEEEGSHVAAKDEGNYDSFATAVELAENGEMDEQDEGCEDEKPVEEIFEKLSPEEIRYYYELMWQQATDSQVAENMKPEDSMWEHHMMKATLNFIEGEKTWQNAIAEFEDNDGRLKPKELEEEQKKKAKMKKKIKRTPEYKVWSKRKKKTDEGKTNFVKQCKPG